MHFGNQSLGFYVRMWIHGVGIDAIEISWAGCCTALLSDIPAVIEGNEMTLVSSRCTTILGYGQTAYAARYVYNLLCTGSHIVVKIQRRLRLVTRHESKLTGYKLLLMLNISHQRRPILCMRRITPLDIIPAHLLFFSFTHWFEIRMCHSFLWR